MNIFLFLSLSFLFIFLVGRLIEKIRVPWIFAALLLGVGLAAYNPFSYLTNGPEFTFLAQLGMYFLLFVVGFEIDLHKLKNVGGFIVKSTGVILILSTLLGGVLVYWLFGTGWLISLLVALSFATVGEAILIPILDEFKIINTPLGQSIIGIGSLDDVIEVLTLVIAALAVGTAQLTYSHLLLILGSVAALFVLTFILRHIKEETRKFNFLTVESLFLVTLFIFFLFIGIGEYGQAAAIAALLAGIGIRTFLPDSKVAAIEKEVRAVCYGFFAPIFFIWVGVSMDLRYLFNYPNFILLVVLVSAAVKLLGVFLTGWGRFNVRELILLSSGLSIRFSTSIVVIKILHDNNLIGMDLYSVIIASSIVFTFVIPVLFSKLLLTWGEVKD